MNVDGEAFKPRREYPRIIPIVEQPLILATETSGLRRERIPDLDASNIAAAASVVVLRPGVLYCARSKRPLPKLPASINRPKSNPDRNCGKEEERRWKRQAPNVDHAQSLPDYSVQFDRHR